MKKTSLSTKEYERYARHLSLPQMGREGQEKLKRASVCIVGLGGLGSISGLYLTLAGVGTLGLIEDDRVSLHNLHRQILYTTDDIGESKMDIAVEKLSKHNPEVAFRTYRDWLTKDNAADILGEFDLVVDGTDNLKTRRVINQTCVALDKPYIYGAVNLFDGQVSVFHASRGPCLACLFPHPPQEEKEKRPEQLAVLNTLPGVVGALQAAETFKVILGIGTPLVGKLLIYNALNAVIERVQVEKNPHCIECGS